MITDFQEDRLLITSDTHLGSFSCRARGPFTRFVEFACANNFNICINGDGIDVLHTSLGHITRDVSRLLGNLKHILSSNTKIYYVIGNHDIILEHFLGDWGSLRLAPFLNLTSGNLRIRVEHGHLYDPFFMKHPDLQTGLTRFMGIFLRMKPGWYNWHNTFRKMRHGKAGAPTSQKDKDGRLYIPGQNPAFIQAADELARRGFDYVIMGHTHAPGMFELTRGRKYVNTGSWFHHPHYVQIENGSVELKPWNG
jgi:UDP-2,3-diacylglucosamine pyrophosphatase LpxH